MLGCQTECYSRHRYFWKYMSILHLLGHLVDVYLHHWLIEYPLLGNYVAFQLSKKNSHCNGWHQFRFTYMLSSKMFHGCFQGLGSQFQHHDLSMAEWDLVVPISLYKRSFESSGNIFKNLSPVTCIHKRRIISILRNVIDIYISSQEPIYQWLTHCACALTNVQPINYWKKWFWCNNALRMF